VALAEGFSFTKRAHVFIMVLCETHSHENLHASSMTNLGVEMTVGEGWLIELV
jgi:hypothetical protein